jgi:hypothetical protein
MPRLGSKPTEAGLDDVGHGRFGVSSRSGPDGSAAMPSAEYGGRTIDEVADAGATRQS